MADKEKKPEFVVTDRRLFSTDGELRQDVVEDEERRSEREREKSEAQRVVNEERAAQQQPAPPSAAQTSSIVTEEAAPEGPSAQEQHDSAAAYRESTRDVYKRQASNSAAPGPLTHAPLTAVISPPGIS